MTTETTVAEATVPITLHLPRSLYERLQQTAEAQHQTPEEAANEMVAAKIRQREDNRAGWEALRASYRAKLEREGRLNDPPEKVLQDLRDQREQIAHEHYPD